MAVKTISSPVVIRRNFTTPTTTIRETQLDLGIRPAQSELAQILKVVLSKERQTTLTGAVTAAQDNIDRLVSWALSTQSGLTSFDQKYEDGVFWQQSELLQLVATAADNSALQYSEYGDGVGDGEKVFNPPIIVAANTISLYDIAIETNALFTSGGFSVEVLYQLVQVDAATLSALLARGDLFL